MTKHNLAAVLDHIRCCFWQIQRLTTTARVVDICQDGLQKVDKIIDETDCREEVAEIRERRIDPL